MTAQPNKMIATTAPRMTSVSRQPKWWIRAAAIGGTAMGTGSGAGGGDPERRVAVLDKPPADRRERRHITAGGANADAEAVGQIAKPDLIDQGGQTEAEPKDRRADCDDGSGPEAIGGATGKRPEPVIDDGGDREECRCRRRLRVKFGRNRLQKNAKAIHNAKDDEARRKRRSDYQPGTPGVHGRLHPCLDLAATRRAPPRPRSRDPSGSTWPTRPGSILKAATLGFPLLAV